MPKTILIVDDEPPIRALIVQTLEALEDDGVRLLQATNGTDAVEVARAERPDLILLDVMMPGLNGFEVCEILRGDKDLAKTTIYLVTARGQDFDRAHGEMVGADNYITKPFDPDLLLELAKTALA